jgi:hypothetical protein
LFACFCGVVASKVFAMNGDSISTFFLSFFTFFLLCQARKTNASSAYSLKLRS